MSLAVFVASFGFVTKYKLHRFYAFESIMVRGRFYTQAQLKTNRTLLLCV